MRIWSATRPDRYIRGLGYLDERTFRDSPDPVFRITPFEEMPGSRRG
jgi:hypothetical protein